jgi:hypothetical protein
MNKHTPGEWKVGPASSGRGPSDDGGDYPITVWEDDYPHIIAEVINKTREDTHQPAEANAKLIAAAPDLLEALKECHEYIVGYPTMQNRPITGRARAIIKKATQ